MRIFEFKDRLIPLDKWVQNGVEVLVENYRELFQVVKVPIEKILQGLDWALNILPPSVVMLFFVLVAWRYAGKRVSIFSLATLLTVGYLGLWDETMTTLSMVLCSVMFCAILGIPLGIMAGRSDRFEMFLRPMLDVMQTTPPFVYLVPVVMLFSIGNVSGVLATIVFALPPLIRLTSLGIRSVHPELVEAATAFGATPFQLLCRVQVPLALPSVMAGFNQTIMMSLSMVVIAALIGAGGLGGPVVRGLNTLDIGLATVAGLCIVLIAMVLDRISQGMAKR